MLTVQITEEELDYIVVALQERFVWENDEEAEFGESLANRLVEEAR